VENTTPLSQLTTRLCQPVRRDGRRVRALNPHAPGDAALFEAISRGEFTLNGLRNRDLPSCCSPMPKPQNPSSAVMPPRCHASLLCCMPMG
jgi:hypothetical protein